MAITNQERVGKALELLRQGLGPYVEREIQAQAKAGVVRMDSVRRLADDPKLATKPIREWDVAGLLKLMWETWNEVFKLTLGYAERSLVSELRDWRNKWAHQEPFSSDDADRALDSAERLLTAVSASEAEEVGKLKLELRRRVYEEQVRSERRKGGTGPIETQVTTSLPAWRDVITPHPDVASGRYQQAEFAADLWQVHLGEGTDEYRDPSEFFRRTFLTDSLKHLLVGSARRLAGAGGDPVVQLQTNFGGGKTHSMLALYHLFSGTPPTELPGVEEVLAEAGIKEVPKTRRVVLVGNKISPGNPVTKPDGTVVRTLWGELAWQLGGAKAHARVALDDERATSPGDALRELFNEYGPCLILIDEWVAYARQLHDQGDLPGGSFETQFTFAQTLTEGARAAKATCLVISLPASEPASPHAQADDSEVGGLRGREALGRLQNVIGRLESSWRPATADEGFEIVRRRLFEPLVDPAKFKQRDLVARAFFDFYATQKQEFPPECREKDYERRIQAAYPIHPEVFDRLYGDWSSLVKFQRTRGVLRLMATVIHRLWESGDRNPLILPSLIPIEDQAVQFEMTRYLPENWAPVIDRDVDGPNSLPLRLDRSQPNLGKLHACRRVARTIFLGSAPTTTAAHRGLEDRRVYLGSVMPGESPSVFGDALRRLTASATYLYQDGPRVWYSTQPTVTKLAEDRAEQMLRDTDKVAQEVERRLRADLQQKGDFSRIHVLPASPADVPDDVDARLVVLGTEQSYSKGAGSAAEATAKAILESRGATPRLYRNTLVFLAVDKARMQDLDRVVRMYLAWESILADKLVLNLDPHQVRQAETQLRAADATVNAQLPEAYQWLLVPKQETPQAEVGWQAIRVSGQESLAARASRKLKSEELLITGLAGTRLRLELDRVPLWRGDHVSVQQLVEDFARYTYLPRLRDSSVLLKAIEEGIALLTWAEETFAYADSYDEAEGRFRGLRGGAVVATLQGNPSAVLVRGEVAAAILASRRLATLVIEPASVSIAPGGTVSFSVRGEDQNGQAIELSGVEWKAEGGTIDRAGVFTAGAKEGSFQVEASVGGHQASASVQVSAKAPREIAKPEAPRPGPKRFHGSVPLKPLNMAKEAGQIAEEVVAHLEGLVGAEVFVTLEIEAHIPGGAPEQVVRTVTENCRTLKFTSHGFEKE